MKTGAIVAIVVGGLLLLLAFCVGLAIYGNQKISIDQEVRYVCDEQGHKGDRVWHKETRSSVEVARNRAREVVEEPRPCPACAKRAKAEAERREREARVAREREEFKRRYAERKRLAANLIGRWMWETGINIVMVIGDDGRGSFSGSPFDWEATGDGEIEAVVHSRVTNWGGNQPTDYKFTARFHSDPNTLYVYGYDALGFREGAVTPFKRM